MNHFIYCTDVVGWGAWQSGAAWGAQVAPPHWWGGGEGRRQGGIPRGEELPPTALDPGC